MAWSRYRDISIYGKGFAKEWNTHTIFEIKWDANRDPDQKFSVTFKTNTSDIVDGEQFLGLVVIEYPGRTVNIDLELKYMGTNITIEIRNAQFTGSVFIIYCDCSYYNNMLKINRCTYLYYDNIYYYDVSICC